MKNYVPVTLDQYINESNSITLKRGYRGKNPVVVGANAPIRNQVLAYVNESKRVSSADLKRFVAGLNETNANPNAAATMWLRRNGKFFVTESRDGHTFFKLSTLGKRLVNRFAQPTGNVSEGEVNEKKTVKSDGKAKDAKKGQEDNMLLDKDAEVEESCSKNESVELPKKAKSKLGGRYSTKEYHNLLDDGQDKDEKEIEGFEKEITEGEGLSAERRERIEQIIENIRQKNTERVDEAKEDDDAAKFVSKPLDKNEQDKIKKEKVNEEKEEEEVEAEADELSFDDLDLSGEEGGEKEEAEGEEGEEGEEKEEGEEDLDLDLEGGEEGEEDEKVEITEFIITVDDLEAAIEELGELGVTAERVLAEGAVNEADEAEEGDDLEGEEGEEKEEEGEEKEEEGEDEAKYSETEISVKAEDWEPLKGWLEDKGVDVEEMFGGEIEVEDDLEDEGEGEELDLDVDVDGDGDMDAELDLEGGEGEGEELDLDLEGGEEEVEESITGMENHEDDTNNLIKGAKQVVINYK